MATENKGDEANYTHSFSNPVTQEGSRPNWEQFSLFPHEAALSGAATPDSPPGPPLPRRLAACAATQPHHPASPLPHPTVPRDLYWRLGRGYAAAWFNSDLAVPVQRRPKLPPVDQSKSSQPGRRGRSTVTSRPLLQTRTFGRRCVSMDLESIKELLLSPRPGNFATGD
ncbi:uncharacterized protein LOC119309303 [Triticum dicoccoides]|uniref:uncharacterized protein LOC119309303 n=1 Tax=Triticum dicoccoides TaxID=85692 RepID=UPI001891DE2F|nr:uncharacterized protein LOC119309303 [Triticum dicoccoides]